MQRAVGEVLRLFAAAEGIGLQIMACCRRLQSVIDYLREHQGTPLRVIEYQYHSRVIDYFVVGRWLAAAVCNR